jgi:hypothetical protein|tara:strand:- start:7487 stop:7777 length:291 start_codon:yes stop_codon:yes gene_type:complete
MIKLHSQSPLVIKTYSELTEQEENEFVIFDTDQDLGDHDTIVNFNGQWFTAEEMCDTLITQEQQVPYTKYVQTGIASGFLFNLETKQGAHYQFDVK